MVKKNVNIRNKQESKPTNNSAGKEERGTIFNLDLIELK